MEANLLICLFWLFFILAKEYLALNSERTHSLFIPYSDHYQISPSKITLHRETPWQWKVMEI